MPVQELREFDLYRELIRRGIPEDYASSQRWQATARVISTPSGEQRYASDALPRS